MATTLKEGLEYVLKADDDTRKGFDSAKKGLKGYEKKTRDSTKAMRADYKRLALQVASVTTALLAIRGTFRFLEESVALANEQELAEKRLATALGHSSQALVNYAAALQKQSTYGDETIIQAEALIAAFVKDEDAVKKATKATLDLAAAKAMPLKNAADLVAKTLGSSTNALSRWGIEVHGAAGSAERLSSLLAGLEAHFGGQAAAELETFGGKVKSLSNVWGDVKEQVGATITKDSEFLDSIDRLKEALEAAGPAIADFAKLLSHVALGYTLIGQAAWDLATTTLRERLMNINQEIEKQIEVIKRMQEIWNTLGSRAAEEDLARAREHLDELVKMRKEVYAKIKGLEPGDGGTADGAARKMKERREQELADFRDNEAKKAYARAFYAQQAKEQREQELADYWENYTLKIQAHQIFADQEKAIRDKEYWDVVMNQQMIADAEEMYAERRARIQEEMVSRMGKAMYALYEMTGRQSALAFRAYQAFSIGETIISTIKAAQDAYAWGMKYGGPAAPYVAAAAAAAATVQGMARVAAIASQKVGGGAAVAPTGAGASYNPVTPTRPAEGVNAGGAQEKAMTVNFHITGAVLDKESLVESIADTMEEFAQDKRLNFKLQYEK